MIPRLPVEIIDIDEWIEVWHGNECLYRGHTMAPFHWAEILAAFGIPVITVPMPEDPEAAEDALEAYHQRKRLNHG